MLEILFVINPIAGGKDKKKGVSRIKLFCQQQNIAAEIYETNGVNDHQLIPNKINNKRYDVIAVYGGDGTFNMVAGLLIGREEALALLPGGSANGMALNLGIPEGLEPALQLLIKGKKRCIDTLLVNNKHYCIHLGDVGFNAKVVERFHQFRRRGKISYFKSFMYVLFHLRPSRYHIFFEGRKSIKTHAHMVAFANARMYGTGAVINPNGILDDGEFEVCVFKPYPWYGIMSIAWRFFSGTLDQSDYVKIYPVKTFHLQSKKKKPLEVDGEYLGEHKKVKVTIIPRSLNIITAGY